MDDESRTFGFETNTTTGSEDEWRGVSFRDACIRIIERARANGESLEATAIALLLHEVGVITEEAWDGAALKYWRKRVLNACSAPNDSTGLPTYALRRETVDGRTLTIPLPFAIAPYEVIVENYLTRLRSMTLDVLSARRIREFIRLKWGESSVPNAGVLDELLAGEDMNFGVLSQRIADESPVYAMDDSDDD